MDITINNFKENLTVIQEAIKSASFLSIDGEFSGLNQTWNLSPYDTPEERFQKVRQNAEDFLLIQFGLCTFNFDEKTEKYTQQAFNFYVFPRTCKKITSDKRFYCQASSLDFLVSQGFDFNKLIKEGISYVRASEEPSLREALAQRQMTRQEEEESLANGTGTPKISFVPDEHKDFIENIHSQIEEFLTSEKTTMQLCPCSAYRRKLIYETVKPKFLSLSLETVQSDNGQPTIQVVKANAEDMKKKAEDRLIAENDKLEEAIGLTKVIQMITESRKLVVGHNMLLDLLHVVHQFCCELPESYEDLKEVMKTVLPRVIDTKLMASVEPFKEHIQHTGLSNILKRVNEDPFSCPTVECTENCPGYSATKEQLHEAGYDAYITGLCYISLAQYLATLQKKKSNLSKDVGTSHLVEPFINKVFMMMSPDVPYLNLAGYDLQPNREHVFHVNFPSEWKSQDIFNLFTPYGPVSISWINDTSAFVALKHVEKALGARRGLVKKNEKEYKVITFNDFCKNKQEARPKDISDISEKQTPSTFSAKRKNHDRSPSRLVSLDVCKKMDTLEYESSDKESPITKRTKPRSKLFDEPTSWD